MSELTFVEVPRGAVCTQGGHATRWLAPDGRDVLFVSAQSRFEKGTAIRGGVPVVFPWFGDDPERRGRPAHGFARRVPWRLVEDRTDRAAGRVALSLQDGDSTRGMWPHEFEVDLTIELGKELTFALAVTNHGDQPFRFEWALHSYFAVGDVRNVEVRGLAGARYHDKLAGERRSVQREEVLRFCAETDRIYCGTSGSCTLLDPGLRRTIQLDATNAPSLVVWNPWIEKTARLLDLGDDEWPRFLCIESGGVLDDAVELAPGAVHKSRVRIRVAGS